MLRDFTDYYDNNFSVLGVGYIVDKHGNLTTTTGDNLGHLESCIDEGIVILKLFELIDQIEIDPSIFY